MARSSDLPFPLSLLRDKTFQAREVRRVMFLAGIYLVVTTALVGVFYHLILSRLVEGAAPLFFVSEDIEMFNDSIPALGSVLGRWIAIMMVVNVIITVGIATYVTRKLGQPILAIKRALRDIGNGEVNVRLRESDNSEFGEIAIALNDAMERVRDHIAIAQSHVQTVAELSGKEAANSDTSDAPQEKAGNANLASALREAESALSYFNTYKG